MSERVTDDEIEELREHSGTCNGQGKTHQALRTLLRAIDEQKADLTELQNAVNWWSSECKRLDNDYSLELCELLMAYRKRGKMKTASPVKNND